MLKKHQKVIFIFLPILFGFFGYLANFFSPRIVKGEFVFKIAEIPIESQYEQSAAIESMGLIYEKVKSIDFYSDFNLGDRNEALKLIPSLNVQQLKDRNVISISIKEEHNLAGNENIKILLNYIKNKILKTENELLNSKIIEIKKLLKEQPETYPLLKLHLTIVNINPEVIKDTMLESQDLKHRQAQFIQLGLVLGSLLSLLWFSLTKEKVAH